jgi:hypothetical protein
MLVSLKRLRAPGAQNFHDLVSNASELQSFFKAFNGRPRITQPCARSRISSARTVACDQARAPWAVGTASRLRSRAMAYADQLDWQRACLIGDYFMSAISGVQSSLNSATLAAKRFNTFGMLMLLIAPHRGLARANQPIGRLLVS